MVGWPPKVVRIDSGRSAHQAPATEPPPKSQSRRLATLLDTSGHAKPRRAMPLRAIYPRHEDYQQQVTLVHDKSCAPISEERRIRAWCPSHCSLAMCHVRGPEHYMAATISTRSIARVSGQLGERNKGHVWHSGPRGANVSPPRKYEPQHTHTAVYKAR